MCINFYSFIKVFVEIYYLKNYLPKLALKHRLKFTADVPLHRLAQLKLLQLRRVHGLSSSSLDISPNNRYIFIAKHRLHLLPALLLPTVSLSLWSSLCTILRWTARRISLHHICKALILSVFRLCWSTICSLSLTPIDAHLFAGLATALYSSPNLSSGNFSVHIITLTPIMSVVCRANKCEFGGVTTGDFYLVCRMCANCAHLNCAGVG